MNQPAAYDAYELNTHRHIYMVLKALGEANQTMYWAMYWATGQDNWKFDHEALSWGRGLAPPSYPAQAKGCLM